MPQVNSIIRTMAMSVFVACATIATAATAQEFQQIELTEEQISKFIAAQADLAKVDTNAEAPAEDAKGADAAVDEKLEKELDAIAAKHGFKDYEELDDVAANIALVLAGIDDATGEYADPRKQLDTELAEVKADDKLAEEEKNDMIKEIQDAIAATPELKYPGNVDLVKKHRKEIEKSLE